MYHVLYALKFLMNTLFSIQIHQATTVCLLS